MEARRPVEFTDVELAGGLDLAASVEKATAGLVEKVVASPRAAVVRGGQEVQWRGRKTGHRALGAMEMPVDRAEA
jgi:inactivated superfamily I helicase